MADPVEPPNVAIAYHPHIELYDLAQDPWEFHNVAEEPAYADTRRELCSRLYAHLEATGDPILEGAGTSPHHLRAQELLSGGA